MKRIFGSTMIASRNLSKTVSLPVYPVHASVRGIACLLCSLVAINMGYANAQNVPEWENVASGTTQVSNIPSVQYMVGYSSIGYDHFRSEIMVSWHDGDDRTQNIYDGIYDNPPAKVWSARDHLCVSIETCARYEDTCKTHSIAYRYDRAAKLFSELNDDAKMCR